MKIEKILERYKRYSEQLERESRRLDQWTQLMPIGQPFPSYEKAALKHAFSFETKLSPLWNKIKNRVDITKSSKTLWQHFPLVTETFPPMYNEIEPFLKIEIIKFLEMEK